MPITKETLIEAAEDAGLCPEHMAVIEMNAEMIETAYNVLDPGA